MRNQFFLLTVLAVAFWTGRGDQRIPEEANRGEDFQFDDTSENGSGSFAYSSDDEDSPWSSSLSSYEAPEEDGSGSIEIIHVSLHLNKNFIPAYYDPESLPYQQLEKNFTFAVIETFENSPLMDHFISTHILNFSPGSVQVNYELEMDGMTSVGTNMVISVKQILDQGLTSGRFDGLSANASSLVVKAVSNEPMMTTTESQNMDETTDRGKDKTDSKYRPGGDGDKEVNKEENNIFDLILDDPIIIAAIVGGFVVIILSVILLFLFVVYRLKKKDEGSYSLDEPAKSKDPTAYWKETKEFYA